MQSSPSFPRWSCFRCTACPDGPIARFPELR
jgi:hypothetical protein